MTEEKKLAENIMRVHGKDIWESCAGGETVGGLTFSMYYTSYFRCTTPYENSQALAHWLEYAGLDDAGKFIYRISNSIQNC